MTLQESNRIFKEKENIYNQTKHALAIAKQENSKAYMEYKSALLDRKTAIKSDKKEEKRKKSRGYIHFHKNYTGDMLIETIKGLKEYEKNNDVYEVDNLYIPSILEYPTKDIVNYFIDYIPVGMIDRFFNNPYDYSYVFRTIYGLHRKLDFDSNGHNLESMPGFNSLKHY